MRSLDTYRLGSSGTGRGYSECGQGSQVPAGRLPSVLTVIVEAALAVWAVLVAAQRGAA